VLLPFLSGCGAQYRPVVTPITPTGPAAQPAAYVYAVSSPSATSPGLVSIVDAFGDTVEDQATLGNGPFSFLLNGQAFEGYNVNGAATETTSQASFSLNAYPLNAASGTGANGGLRTQDVNTSSIPAEAFPFNGISTTNALYLVEPYIDPVTRQSTSAAALKPANTAYVAELTGAGAPSLQQEIPVAPNPVNFAGTSGGPRIWTISQGNSTNGPLTSADACNAPATVTTAGEADSIEVTTNTVSNRIPLGICPVYGIESPDYLRAYILNRGSGTITVINGQSNSLDTTIPGNNGSANIKVGAGPVFADLYSTASLLVTANYDSNSISVINVPTDQFNNDAPNFGTVTTIPVGHGPVALTILRDGSKAYVANQIDGTISVVNLSSFTVTKTIALAASTPTASNPTGAVHPKSIASVLSTPASAVFVVSPESNTITAINTETDTVSATVQLPANALFVYTNTQNASASSPNSIVNSNASGFGVPCGPDDTSPFCPAQP